MASMQKTRRTTITDVAKLAGVGKVTVSYVLSGQGRTARISEKTEERIRKAAVDLGYRPNALARMLVTQRTDMIAVVLQRGSYFTQWSGFTSELLRGVSTAAVERGFDLVLHTQEIDKAKEADKLSDGRFDGALVLRDEDDSLVDELSDRGFPCVRFFSHAADRPTPFVDAANHAGASLAVNHLLELGHRDIVMIRGTDKSTSSNERYRAYRELVADRDPSEGYRARVLQIFSAGDNFQPFRELMQSADRPTAVFAWSDEVAFGCMSILRELGLSVPEDVSVVGFDSLPECERSVPALTSVQQPVFSMAREATRLLIDLISGSDPAETQIHFPLALDVRGSTAHVNNQPFTKRWTP